MNLSVMFPARQLIFAAVCVLMLATAPSSFAQTQPDYVLLKPAQQNAPPRQLQNAVITGAQITPQGIRIMIREGAGEIGYDVAQIQTIQKAAPPEFANGMTFVERGQLDKALPFIKAVADKYKGLPTPWAQDATAMLGNIYISTGKLAEADLAFKDFEKAYGASGSQLAEVGRARLAAARGKYEEAKSIAGGVVGSAMTQKNISRAQSQLYGQAYFALGQAAEGEKKLPEAMEHYCRVVAIFYQERSIVAEAQKRIDELRQKGVSTP